MTAAAAVLDIAASVMLWTGFAAACAYMLLSLAGWRSRPVTSDRARDPSWLAFLDSAWMLLVSASFGCQTLADVISHTWGWVPLDAGLCVVYALLWWRTRKRRRRDRAPRAFGAKSRARIAALVRKVRQTARARPVLRPVPEGAR